MQPDNISNKKSTVVIGIVVILLATVIAGIAVAMVIDNTKQENADKLKDCVEIANNQGEKVERCAEKYVGMKKDQAIKQARKDGVIPAIVKSDVQSDINMVHGEDQSAREDTQSTKDRTFVYFEIENKKVKSASFKDPFSSNK